jgi:type VI secretion system protein VasD
MGGAWAGVIRLLGWLPGCVGAALVVAACSAVPSSVPAVKEPLRLEMAVRADDHLNPDDKARAAPVLVRLYELKTEPPFEAADYFTLHKQDKTALAQDLLARDEFIMRPGEVRLIERRMHPDATAIGLVVGYRDLGKSTWRAVFKLPPSPQAAWYRAALPDRKVKLSVLLGSTDVLIKPIE